MRTLDKSVWKRPEAIATTGMPAAVSSDSTTFDSHNGGGRITPATLCAILRAAARSAAWLMWSQRIEHELSGSACGAGQRADEQLAQIGGARIRVDQRDARPLRAGQRASGGVRRVVELAHGAHDAFARRVTHVAVAVHHARDGHRRDAGVACDLMDRNGIALASLGARGVLHSHGPDYCSRRPQVEANKAGVLPLSENW